jgi:hypothetical protein
MKKILMAAAAVVTFGAVSGTASAELCGGDDVTWIIPFSEGGGSGKWARFWAPQISEQLGQNVIVEYMPGAGSTMGANFFQNEVEGDGCTIFGSSGSTQFPYLLGDDRVEYEYREWQVVIATPTGGVVYTTPEIAEGGLENASLSYGSQGATSLDLVPLLAFNLLGYNVEPIFGLKGRSAGRAAFLAGETTIDYQTSSAYLSNIAPVVEAGEAVALMSWGAVDANGDIVRDPTFPDLPHFSEVLAEVNPAAMDSAGYSAWKAFFTAGFAAQKMVFLPGDASADDVATLTAAFEAATKVEGFGEASMKRLGVYPQGIGDGAAVLLEKALDVDETSLEFVKGWLKEAYGVEL